MDGYSFLEEKKQTFAKEKRVNKRSKYDCKFKVESVNSKKVDIDAKGLELSISGMGFICDKEFKINDILEISFKYKNVTIPAIVKIEHINLYDFGFLIGGRFVALQDSYRDILKYLE